MRIVRKYKLIVSAIILIATIALSFIIFSKTVKLAAQANVILITCDALRPDHLGCYGYKLVTSPNIDRFREGATLFIQAITQGSKTPLALPSLFTSTYARTHGCYREGYKIISSIPTLAEILKKNNYSTAAIVDSIKHIQGLERGFDTFIDYRVKRADKTTDKAIMWLKKNHNQRFFLWLHYFDTHGPYRPPEPYKSMFMDKLKLGHRHVPVCSRMYSCDKDIPLSIAEDNITDPDYYISQYDGEIRFVDEQIGRLLNEIKKLSLDKDSIIIFTADHGEMLGEHEIYFEHSTLYDQTLMVPLLIKFGKIKSVSKTVIQQVRLIDIAPTILDFLGISKDKHMQGDSLLPLILGKSKNAKIYAISEKARPEINLIEECIRTEEWKLIYHKVYGSERYELYDLNHDPQELNDLVNIENDKFESLKKDLNNWRKETPISKPESFLLTEEVRQLLRNLGYLQ